MIELLTNALMGMGVISLLLLAAILMGLHHLAQSGHLKALVEKYTRPPEPPAAA